MSGSVQILAVYVVLTLLLVSRVVDLAPARMQTIVEGGSYYKTEQDESKAQNFTAESTADGAPPRQSSGQMLNDEVSGEQIPAVPTVTITEGDIMTDTADPNSREPTSGSSRRRKRKVFGDRWPRGIIPWEINTKFPTYTADQMSKITQSMQWWQQHTCLRFVQENNGRLDRRALGISHKTTLSISNDNRCSSYVGFHDSSEKQTLNLLNSRCFSSAGTPAHEIGHALGLIHEHTRYDRDEHININPHAISESSLGNFVKTQNTIVPGDVPYDLSSIMHYSPTSFSNSIGEPSITGRNLAKQSLMGQRDSLGYYDIKTINYHYNCEQHCTNRCENEGYPHYLKDKRRCVCICPEGLSGANCEKIESNCGGEIRLTRSGERFTLAAQNYLMRNKSARKCMWTITAPHNHLISIEFHQFNVQKSSKTSQECLHHVEIRNNVLAQRGDIYCGSGPMGQITTEDAIVTNNMMIILDMTDRDGTNDDSFTATLSTYTDACQTNPCHPGSECVRAGSSYRCNCPLGYSGARCDEVTEGAVSCDFSDDLCSFSQGTNDNMDFSRIFISTRYGQKITRRSEGNMYFLGAPVAYETPAGSTVTLMSPNILSITRSTRCLQFSYFYNQDDKFQNGEISVDLISSSTNRPIRTLMKVGKTSQLASPGISGWREHSLQINERQNYKVMFKFTTDRRRTYTSTVGIDDISLLPRSCNSSPCSSNPCQGGGVCSEINASSYRCLCQPGRTGTNCQYMNTAGFKCDFDADDLCGWTQDTTDHYEWVKTFGASDKLKRTGPVKSAVGDGYYMVAESSQQAAQRDNKARILSPLLQTSRDGLCISFYYHMHGRDVGAFRFILQSPNRQQTILFTKHGSQSTQWQYKELHVPAHTIQQGSRLVFEATVGRQHLSDIAVDDIKVSQGKCAEFSLPSVQIPATTRQPTPTIRQRIQSAVRQPVVRTSSSEGAPADTRDVQRINAVTSRQQVQTTARLIQPTKPGINTQQLLLAKNLRQKLKKSNQNPVNNGIAAAAPTSSPTTITQCDFEDGNLCSFTDDMSAKNRWTVKSGSTPTVSTGPERAATGSYYAYVEATGTQTNSKARLRSPSISPNMGDMCLQFYLHMYGEGIGDLSVYQVFTDGSQTTLMVRQGADIMGDHWRGIKLPISNSNSRSFVVVFETLRIANSLYYRGDIALDGISLNRGRC